MSRILILGATGSLGRHVLRQALVGGHEVTAVVRSPSRLPPEAAKRVAVSTGDLRTEVPLDLFRGHDALINCAGHVADGAMFVTLVDRLVTSVERLPPEERPVCWFLGGAALLDLDRSGRRGVELPKVKSVYWPHRANFDRLTWSRIDWRLLCPGPMVDEPALGVHRLRISLDTLPVQLSAVSRVLPGPLLLPVFASVIPRMVVPYEDAAAVMLANLARGNAMSRHRVGLALPVGMRGRKPRSSARVTNPRP